MKLKPVLSKRDIRLEDEDARVRGDIDSDKTIDRATDKQCERISELQRVFYADGRYAMLIVLQGRDAAGKDGLIRKVFSGMNPQGCTVSTFKAPSEYEASHDFLWRVHQRVPPRGMIGIFNRSHYEDILVPRVRGLVPKKVWSARYDQINDFESMLAANGTVILKFMLHISRDEQKERLEARLSDKSKNWKFRAGDLEDRDDWDEFTKAYRGILANTSTKHAPWFIVPADDKDVRDWLVSRTIADTMKKLKLRYPKAEDDLSDIEIE